ncbi:MAG: hypothetical protein CVT49_08200 [candidate division Zixibacteria bacterium HGW-Zixibacteria-1]|nr:MAG: hypothetical protein CVT49_08200 [candidate division Zixibacteria bacterium HGW-Zixibacteria-1]
MAKEDRIIESIKSENEDFYTDDSIFDISSWGADLSFRELIERYKTGELVKPEIQRKYIWDRIEASYFIDSILLGLPIPSIFLARTKDEKMLIVDGYQRIMTVYDFVEKRVFSQDGKDFKLSMSKKIHERWRGKTFAELDDAEQRRIKNTTIHSIIFVQLKPKEPKVPDKRNTSMFQIFERINTSGRTLLSQEIRNCIYQGSLNSALIELNEHPVWRNLYGLENADSRMRDIEFILRYLAMSSHDFRTDRTKSISLKKFLNEFMNESQNPDEMVIRNMKDDFLATIHFVADLFGEEAFRNISKIDPERLVHKFNPTIFDSIMLASSYARANLKHSEMIDFRERRRALLKDASYQNAIRIRTTNIDQIKLRISLAMNYLYGMSYE